jgi:hypothetical protein
VVAPPEPRLFTNENLFEKSKVEFSVDNNINTINIESIPGVGTMDPAAQGIVGGENVASPSLDPLPKMTFEEIQKEKQDLLFKLDRLAKKGIHMTRKYNMSSQLEDIREEFNRIKTQRDMENSVKFQRKMLMALVTGVEFLNTKFDPLDVQLEGWSESVHENLDDYDDIFEELHEKYKEKTKIAPELRLMMSLTGSAFMYHLSQSLFKSAMPSANDIHKQNPHLMRQFGQAAMSSMSQANPSFGNFMNDAIPARYHQGGASAPPPPPPTGAAAAAAAADSSLRREMKGPSDLNDLLGALSSSMPSMATTTTPHQNQGGNRVRSMNPATSHDISVHSDQLKNIEVSTLSGDLRKKKNVGINLSI